MPELPEVEVTRRRLAAELTGARFTEVTVRVAKLRLPVPVELPDILPGLKLHSFHALLIARISRW